MRIPNRILEHPIEALIAGLLLLALLFVSSDPQSSHPRRPGSWFRKKCDLGSERSLKPLIIICERTSDPERPQPLRQPVSGVRSHFPTPKEIRAICPAPALLPADAPDFIIGKFRAMAPRHRSCVANSTDEKIPAQHIGVLTPFFHQIKRAGKMAGIGRVRIAPGFPDLRHLEPPARRSAARPWFHNRWSTPRFRLSAAARNRIGHGMHAGAQQPRHRIRQPPAAESPLMPGRRPPAA